MIKPSEVNTATRFWDSGFQNLERETVARNITVLNQALAYDADDDRWQPFTVDEYVTFRTATSTEPVGAKERGVMYNMANEGYLELDDAGHYAITSRFLGVVVQFATPEAVDQVTAK